MPGCEGEAGLSTKRTSQSLLRLRNTATFIAAFARHGHSHSYDLLINYSHRHGGGAHSNGQENTLCCVCVCVCVVSSEGGRCAYAVCHLWGRTLHACTDRCRQSEGEHGRDVLGSTYILFFSLTVGMSLSLSEFLWNLVS